MVEHAECKTISDRTATARPMLERHIVFCRLSQGNCGEGRSSRRGVSRFCFIGLGEFVATWNDHTSVYNNLSAKEHGFIN